MDYSRIINELKKASLFDLYRVSVAVRQLLEDPEKTAAVRARLRPGMKIKFFDSEINDLVEATVLELHRTRLSVLNHRDNGKWSISFFSVNIDDVDTNIISLPSPGGAHSAADGNPSGDAPYIEAELVSDGEILE